MANTNPSGVANTLDDIVVQITEVLDEVYAHERKTTPWQPNPAFVRGFQRAKTGQLATIFTDPLADYDRALGYVAGAAGIEWNPYELRFDRGRSYVLDQVDMMQQEGVFTAMATMAVTAREQVVPEQEKLAFASAYAQMPTANIISHTISASTVLQQIGDLLDSIRDTTGVENGYSIFMSGDTRKFLRSSTEVQKVRNIDGYMGRIDLTSNEYDGQQIIYVPTAWMNGGWESVPGGGVQLGTTPKTIEVMITAPDTVQNIVAHSITDVFGPGLPNGKSELVDGTRINTRIFYDTIIPLNKRPGVGAIVIP